jgi:hypothetical protein
MNIPDAHTLVNVPMSVLAHALLRHVTDGGRTAHELTVKITPESGNVYEHLPVVTVCLGPGNGDYSVYYSRAKKDGDRP